MICQLVSDGEYIYLLSHGAIDAANPRVTVYRLRVRVIRGFVPDEAKSDEPCCSKSVPDGGESGGVLSVSMEATEKVYDELVMPAPRPPGDFALGRSPAILLCDTDKSLGSQPLRMQPPRMARRSLAFGRRAVADDDMDPGAGIDNLLMEVDHHLASADLRQRENAGAGDGNAGNGGNDAPGAAAAAPQQGPSNPQLTSKFAVSPEGTHEVMVQRQGQRFGEVVEQRVLGYRVGGFTVVDGVVHIFGGDLHGFFSGDPFRQLTMRRPMPQSLYGCICDKLVVYS